MDRDAGHTARQWVRARADERDIEADARDRLSDSRDMAANLAMFLEGGQDRGNARMARRLASQDRTESKRDRMAAASDRSALSGHHDSYPNINDD